MLWRPGRRLSITKSRLSMLYVFPSITTCIKASLLLFMETLPKFGRGGSAAKAEALNNVTLNKIATSVKIFFIICFLHFLFYVIIEGKQYSSFTNTRLKRQHLTFYPF